MADMVSGIPVHLEKIEHEAGFLRRNSTGSFDKVSPRYLSDPKGSCHDACKFGFKPDLQTRVRTSFVRRSVAPLGKIPELATVKLQIKKKPLSSSKLPVNFKRHTTPGKSRRQESPARTKRLPVSVKHQAYSKSRRYSEIIIPAIIPRDSPLHCAPSRTNTGSSKLSNKKAGGQLANTEKTETGLGYLRRNSTGDLLGIEMGDSNVLSRRGSVPPGSCLDASKDGVKRNLKTKARTRMSTRHVTSSRENSELATTVKLQVQKKPQISTKVPANFKKMSAATKRSVVSVSDPSYLTLKPLEKNVFSLSRSHKLGGRRYSDTHITGDSPILHVSLLDNETSRSNTGSKKDKDVCYLRRNSTGSLGIEMGESKVLPCFPSVLKRSRKEVCKERDLKAKGRTLNRHIRSVNTSREVPEMATTVKLHKGKKTLSSSKLSNFKIRTTFGSRGQKFPACSKVVVSVNHQTGLKLKPLKETASSMPRVNKLRIRRYSDTDPKEGSPILTSSGLDGETSRSDKNTGSSELNKKKGSITIPRATISSVKRVSSKKSNNSAPRMVSERTNLTSVARMTIVQPSRENLLNKASQLNKMKKLQVREPKAKNQTMQLSEETQKAKVSPLNRPGINRGKRPSPILSPSYSLKSDRSSSRNIGNRKSSLSSISVCESFDGDSTVSSSKKSGTTSQNQAPKNLKLRRGKNFNFQSEKVSTARRLKFRPAKLLDNSEYGSSHIKRSFRRLMADRMSNAAKNETVRVNLRHQSRGDKKEAPMLFNNVIEETATKLAEKRRSKVKALVGAFETVISLQDPKPSPPTI